MRRRKPPYPRPLAGQIAATYQGLPDDSPRLCPTLATVRTAAQIAADGPRQIDDPAGLLDMLAPTLTRDAATFADLLDLEKRSTALVVLPQPEPRVFNSPGQAIAFWVLAALTIEAIAGLAFWRWL